MKISTQETVDEILKVYNECRECYSVENIIEMSGLSIRQKMALKLRYCENKTYKEIGMILLDENLKDGSHISPHRARIIVESGFIKLYNDPNITRFSDYPIHPNSPPPV